MRQLDLTPDLCETIHYYIILARRYLILSVFCVIKKKPYLKNSHIYSFHN